MNYSHYRKYSHRAIFLAKNCLDILIKLCYNLVMDRLIKSLDYQGTTIKRGKVYTEGYQIVYVLSGYVDIIVADDREYHVTAPSVVLLNHFEHYTVVGCSDDYMRFSMTLNPEIIDHHLDFKLKSMMKYRPNDFIHAFNIDRDTIFHINRIFSIISDEMSGDKAYHDELIGTEVYHMLILLYRANPNKIADPVEYVISVQNYIDTDYIHIDDVKQIADKFNISSSHLSHTFKDKTGYSPKEYLTATRLFHAQHYLTYSDISIGAICKLIGYKDINNFIRQFRTKYGIPPLQFRKEDSMFHRMKTHNSKMQIR